jgi:hypothetical protein
MSRIPIVTDATASPEARKEIEALRAHGKDATNMKRTLLHSIASFHAYQEWYPLADELKEFIGNRGLVIFANAISVQSDCLLCSTFFRRDLVELGEDPDHPVFTDSEELLVEFGRQIAKDSNRVGKKLYDRVKAKYTDRQIVQLTAFAGIMIATNIFNNALEIEVDESLSSYLKKK